MIFVRFFKKVQKKLSSIDASLQSTQTAIQRKYWIKKFKKHLTSQLNGHVRSASLGHRNHPPRCRSAAGFASGYSARGRAAKDPLKQSRLKHNWLQNLDFLH